MAFRPLRDEEQADILKSIDEVKETITTHQKYLQSLERELREGVWYNDTPLDPVEKAKAQEVLAKMHRGTPSERFAEINVGDKVRDFITGGIYTVTRKENFATAGYCIFVKEALITYKPEFLEKVK